MLIISRNDDTNGVVIAWPAEDCGIPVEEIARKDTPAGVPYVIVRDDDIPKDQTYFGAWEFDFSNPDGYGIGQEAWFAEQAAKENSND